MPTIPRLYVDQPLHTDADVQVSAGQAHYLQTVIRRAVGDEVHLFNGLDGAWCGRITALRRDRLTISLDRQIAAQTADDDVWLVFALLKRDTTDLVIEKATELGVSTIQPVITHRTNASRINETRLRAIAIEAAEQCERLSVPTVLPPRDLDDVLRDWQPHRPLIAAIERADAPPLRHVPGPCALLVGPEGGFTPLELDGLRRYPFITPVSLGPRVLRAETACIAGLALLRSPGNG